MKTSIFVLCLSLAGNVTLAVLYWKSPPADPAATPATTSAHPAPPARPAVDDVTAALHEHPEFVEAARSGNPHRMRQALIQAGFPDDYVRDMVTFHTGNSVSPDRIDLLRHQAKKPFWESNLSEEGLALQKLLREEEAKTSELNRDVFGGRVPPHPLDALNQQRRYRFLPAEKVEAVARIDSDYAEMESENRRGGAYTAEAAEKARLLQREKRADLAKILTPAELELHDLTLSPTAQSMRRQLALFEPTEAEFRAVFELQRGIDEKYGTPFGPMDQTLMRQRAADTQAMDTKIQTLLGEQRHLEYKRAQDYGYRAAVEIVKHYKLPEANAAEAYALQAAAMKQLAEINRTAGADRSATAAQLGRLVNDTELQLTRLLGAEGLDAYRKTGGNWLASLQRSAPGAGRPAPPLPAVPPR
jgi:hypothetical protein